MKNLIFVIVLIFASNIPMQIFAQNVFVWDRDNEELIINPDDPWTEVGVEYAIVKALDANRITATVDTVLPANLSDYDILFATIGIWCGAWGWTPPEPVGSDDIQAIIDFLISGKACYIEGSIIGTGAHTELYSYFGLGNNSNMSGGYSGIENLYGINGTMGEDYNFAYLYGTNADYGIDELEVGNGTAFLESQDGIVRGIFYEQGTYKTIAASSFFGAMGDGIDENTKASLMANYLEFLYENVNAGNNVIALGTHLGANYPNPFNPITTIKFTTDSTGKNTELIIHNIRGQKVKTLVNEKLDAGNHSVIWNGTDDNGEVVSSGVYFYRLNSGRYTSVKKMILMK